MQVTVQLFAAHREAVGSPVVTLVVPSGTRAGDIWTMLAAQHPALRQVAPPTAVAVNDEVRPAEHALADGDRVALLAPVSGGGPESAGDPTSGDPTTGRTAPVAGAMPITGGPLLDLVREPIRVDALLDAVRHPGAGAVILFLGTVREHSRGRSVHRLEYDAYEALARQEMARIAAHATERWGVRISIVHRLGTLQIGEISVAIAVAAPHRRDAFEAGRFAIDTLKQTVPIWKKEVWASGSEWIGQEESLPQR